MGRLIDCDKLCTDLLERWNIADKNREDQIRWLMADVVTPIVVSQPTVDAVPVRHGRWNCSDDVYETAVCSVCGWDTVEPWVHIKEWFEFCPHCGAKMDGKGDGNDLRNIDPHSK